MYITGYFIDFLLVFLSILLHELGHITSAIFMGKKAYSIRILPVGLNVLIEERTCSRWGRIVIYASGPAVNVLLCILLFVINSYSLYCPAGMRFLILSNISLAVFNIMPVLPLDGGRILRELLAEQFGLFLGSRYIQRLSIFLSIALIILGTIVLSNSIYNFSLLSTGLYVFFTLISGETGEAAFMTVKDVIYRRSRFLKRGVYPARDLVVLKSVQLGEIIKSMDFDRFHIMHVLDEDLKLIKVFTEQEVIDCMLEYGASLTFEELIKKNI